MDDNEMRRDLTSDIFIPPLEEAGLGRLEAALKKVVAAQAVEAKINAAVRAGTLDKNSSTPLVNQAASAGVISEDDCKCLQDADDIRDEVIQVDSFDREAYLALKG